MSQDSPVMELGQEHDETIAGPSTPVDQPAEPTCEKCATPLAGMRTGWCLRCGYYPKIGTFVELDEADRITDEAEEEAESAADLLREIPAWVWIWAGGFVVLIAMSVAARLLIPAESNLRTAWAVGQLGIGYLTFVIAHIACYLAAVMASDQLTILDIFVRPIALWLHAFKELPTSFRRVAAGSWGWAAALLAVTVVGGIPWDSLMDWGGKPAAKKNLVQAIAEQARKAKGEEMAMDEAIEEFAGKAGASDLQKAKPIVRKNVLDCVVIGLITRGEEDDVEISELILASLVSGKLQYVGNVRADITGEEMDSILLRSADLARQEPIVKTPARGLWLEPSILCRVRFEKWTDNKRMKNPELVELLQSIEQ